MTERERRAAVVCHVCGETVKPVARLVTTRQGKIMSLGRYEYFCPNKRCGERLYD